MSAEQTQPGSPRGAAAAPTSATGATADPQAPLLRLAAQPSEQAARAPCAPSSAGEPASRGLLPVSRRPPAGTAPCIAGAQKAGGDKQDGTLTSTETRQEEGLEQETRSCTRSSFPFSNRLGGEWREPPCAGRPPTPTDPTAATGPPSFLRVVVVFSLNLQFCTWASAETQVKGSTPNDKALLKLSCL